MQQLQHAARALGWDGRLVPDVEVLGARFTAVARIRQDVHQWRRHHGWEPELDPAWFKAWSEPERHDQLPVAAVDLIGILVPVSKPSRALRACGMLLSLAPCAVVLPGRHREDPLSMLELDYYGAGIVTTGPDDAGELVLAPENRAAEFGSSMFGRWLLEVLYSRLLENPHIAENA
ncbi:hypothetical protein QFW96_15635 [Saccharopolyspora sp. TS4A08]|uniref:Uncharacterized protein n=1 Tax=Saccharopolyspora ipomoeae TaxID=3042027 RepID=A0ABT6PPW9_9PSEU|nr:hypothetical protein [Saccharopolyspora sp. TS4A08]MDI2030059.1 hypothetical protein [Saccharopolyspora sp. TS4A08]